jgi:hypothetical protein
MRSPAPRRALIAVPLLHLLLTVAVAAQQTRTVTGRVIDESTQQPITDVTVRVRNTPLTAVTGTDGRFVLPLVPVGSHVLTLEHLAYADTTQSLVVRADSDAFVQLRMTSRAVALPGVTVQGRTELDARRQSTGFSMNELKRESIDVAARQGMTLWELLRDEMPQVQVREASRGIAACVEFRGAVRLTGGCNHMAIFVDGVNMSAPGTIYPNIPLGDIERVEALSPGQAGVQYGTLGGNGVLLIETRTGSLPDRDGQRQSTVVFGFDWSQEPTPYRWRHAVGGSFLANTLALGIGLSAARSCYLIEEQTLGLAENCGGFKAFGVAFTSVLLPVIATTLTARWGGSTARSHGQVLPSLLLGSAAAASGYLIIIQGSDVAGGLMLGLGIPALGILSDRLFRVLR